MMTLRPGTKATRLKGGSLSGTWLLEDDRGRRVRKTIDLESNREYGFVRWHSQLKRLQRFGALFPGLFPEVLDVGLDGSQAWFELAYIEGSASGSGFLDGDPGEAAVRAYLDALVEAMDRIHAVRRPSWPGALDLYLHEEMVRPLAVCAADPGFQSFLAHPTIVFNGVEVRPVMGAMPDLLALAARDYRKPFECYTHGNLTLENTLWVPSGGRIWFIDPYEENIADTVQNEYSQVLQSCSAKYEVYNALEPTVEGNRITLAAPPRPGLETFDRLFQGFLESRLSPPDLRIVRLYEISQFTRMLPFKLHVAPGKMIFFYGLASYLAHRLLEDADA